MPDFNIEALRMLSDPSRDALFKEYSAWARHHHTLVWTSAAFGVAIQLAILTLYNDLERVSYTVVAGGGLLLLAISHKLAEGNRCQWANYKSVPNLIEASWDLRIPGSETALNKVAQQKPVRVQPWRRNLYLTFAAIVAATIVVKWLVQIPVVQP